MMKKIMPIFLAVAILLMSSSSALASVSNQAFDVTLVTGTVILNQAQKESILDWLSTESPANTNLYAPSHIHQRDGLTYVSMVGLRHDLEPPYYWQLVSDSEDPDTPIDVIWTGSVTIDAQGETQLFRASSEKGSAKLAALAMAAGGGANIAFPWQAGKSMVYGPRGIHDPDEFGTTGTYAVDWVGGDAFANSAPPIAYASQAGEITYVCDDGVSFAVKVVGADTFVYVHLLENENLYEGYTFNKGQAIGSLKYGTFRGPAQGCGWAEQKSGTYHLHWVFTPRNGRFQAEGFVLDFGDKKWHGSNTAVGIGQSMVGGGGAGSFDVDDAENPQDDALMDAGSQYGTGTYIWDYFINGASTIIFTVMDAVLYKRVGLGGYEDLPIDLNAYGGFDDGLDGGSGLPTSTPTPTPTSGNAPSGLYAPQRPASSEIYTAQIVGASHDMIRESVMVTYIFASAFPSMNLIAFVFFILLLIFSEYIGMMLKIMKLIGDFWNMLRPPIIK